MAQVVHDEVIRVGFDDRAALSQLDALTKAAERLRAVLGGVAAGGGGPPVGFGAPAGSMPGATMPSSGSIPGGGGGGQGMSPTGTPSAPSGAPMPMPSGASAGVPSPAAPSGTTQTPPMSAPMPTPSSATVPGGGGGPTPSGNAWEAGMLAARTARNRAWTAGENVDVPWAGKAGAQPSGMSAFAQNATASAMIQQLGQGMLTGGVGGISRSLFAGMGLMGGPLGGAVASIASSIFDFEGIDRNTARRSQMERQFGFSQLGGFGRDYSIPMLQAFADENAPGGVAFGQTMGGYRGSGFESFLRQASGAGIGPDEAMAMASGYTGAVGGLGRRGAGMMSPNQLIQASLSGIGAGALGGVDQLRTLGGASGTVNTTMAIAGVAQQGFGVQGGLDRWLGNFTSQMDRLIQRGIKVDLDSVSGLMGRMASDPVLSGLGMRAPTVIGDLAQSPRNARDRMMSGFRGIMDNVSLAAAAEGANDFMGLMRNLEGQERDPSKVLRASQRFLDGDARTLALAATMSSLGVDESASLGRMNLGGEAPRFGLNQASRGSRVRAGILAEREARDVVDRVYTPGTQKAASDIAEAQDNFRIQQARRMTNTIDTLDKALNNLGRSIRRHAGELDAMPPVTPNTP